MTLGGRPKTVKGEHFSIYMDKKNHEWLKQQVKKKRFRNVSQAIRECVTIIRNVEKVS